MALAVRKGIFTVGSGTGDVTYNITTGGTWPASTTPKALILFSTREITADAATDTNESITIGFGTRDGGATQQGYVSYSGLDGAATSDCSQGINTTAIFRSHSIPTTPTVDGVATLVSFGSDQFTLNWSDGMTLSPRVHYLVLGGSDITAARVFNFTPTATSTQDVTVNAGFGKPDALIHAWTQATALGDASTNAGIGVGVGNRSGGFMTEYRHQENTTMIISALQRAKAIAYITGNATLDGECDIEPDDSLWPTDGVQYNWTTVPAVAYQTLGLALKGTFTTAAFNSTTPTAAAPQVNTHSLASGTAKGALYFGSCIAANATVDQTHADLGSFWVGGSDGTNEGCAGHLDEDSVGTAVCHRWSRETKALHMRIPSGAGSGTLTSEADSSISGSDFVLTFGDTDTVARVYGGMVFGEAGAPPPPAVIPDLTLARWR